MKNYLPLDDNSIDFVICSHVIEHLYHPIDILCQAQRVLKPGGAILLTTDNAFLLHGLLNYLLSGDHLHEPVSGTAAMAFHEWRGHVRFFSVADLRTLLAAADLDVVDCEFREILYNSLLEAYFTEPVRTFPSWKAKLLSDFPHLRNEILLVATKSRSTDKCQIPVQNGGFETGTIEPWTPFQSVHAALASDHVHSGGFSLAESAAKGSVYQDVRGLAPGVKHTVSAWVSGSPDATATAQIAVWDAGANVATASKTVHPNASWQLLEYEFVVSAESQGVARIHLFRNDGDGTIFWDDVQIANGRERLD